MNLPSASGLPAPVLRRRTGLHVPFHSSRVPDGVANPCRLVLTATPGSNGKSLRVRCECMAQVALTRSPSGYYNYDHIGDVVGLAAAVALWREHKEEQAHEQS